MRSFLTRSLLAFSVVTGTAFAADSYKVDQDHSAFIFKIKHLGLSWTYGQFTKFSGEFSFDTKDPAKSSLSLSIQTDSVFSNAEKRDTHLESPDFFDVKTYPTMTFTGTAFKKVSDTVFEVTGNLTLHGVTKPVTVTLTKVGEGADSWGGYRSGWETSFTIKRSDFGMNFMQGGIGDEVVVTVAVEGIRK